jgi:hypothetical protein
VFSNTGQLVSAPGYGAVAMQTSTYGSNVAKYGNDLICDSIWAVSTQNFVNTACGSSSYSDYWQVNFPESAPIWNVYYLVRTCCANR